MMPGKTSAASSSSTATRESRCSRPSLLAGELGTEGGVLLLELRGYFFEVEDALGRSIERRDQLGVPITRLVANAVDLLERLLDLRRSPVQRLRLEAGQPSDPAAVPDVRDRAEREPQQHGARCEESEDDEHAHGQEHPRVAEDARR